MRELSLSLLSLSIIWAQTSPDNFYKRLTPGLSGTLALTNFSKPSNLGGLGHLQFRLGGTDLFFKYPTYGEWAYIPSITTTVEMGIFKGRSHSQIVSGIFALDLVTRLGLYPKQPRTSTSRFFYGAGVKIGLLKNTLITPAVSIRLEYIQINDLFFGYQDPNLEATYDKLRIFNGSLGIGKQIYGLYPYISIGGLYNMIEGRYIQRALPAPEFVTYEEKFGSFAGLIGCEWKILFLKLNSEILFSGTKPGIAIGLGNGL